MNVSVLIYWNLLKGFVEGKFAILVLDRQCRVLFDKLFFDMKLRCNVIVVGFCVKSIVVMVE